MTQDELNLKFPQEVVVSDRRYCVAWYTNEVLREVVIVFDKILRKVVYKGTSKTRNDHYPYIKKFYGKENCDPPKQVNPSFYADY